jgi:hypothetical protein
LDKFLFNKRPIVPDRLVLHPDRFPGASLPYSMTPLLSLSIAECIEVRQTVRTRTKNGKNRPAFGDVLAAMDT